MIKFWKVSEVYGEFSNWYLCNIFYKDINFNSSEQIFMWGKAKLFNDEDVAEQILQTTDQREIKALGRKVKNFDDEIWKENCYDIMLQANIAKFEQNKNLRKLLYSVKDEVLVEASPYDKIWGIGLSSSDPRSDNQNQWLGQNLLGKCLSETCEYFNQKGWNI